MLSGPAAIASSPCQLRLKYPKTRSKLPSLLRIQPSKYGWISWPLENFVDGSSVGSWPTNSSAANTAAPRPSFMRLRPSGGALLVLRLVDVEEADPREAHLVNGAL